MASKALTKIEEHEKHSLVQHGQLIIAIGEIKTSVDKLFDRFWVAAIALIGLLLAMVAFFVADEIKKARQVTTTQQEHNSLKEGLVK